jgi:hypothetical protein
MSLVENSASGSIYGNNKGSYYQSIGNGGFMVGTAEVVDTKENGWQQVITDNSTGNVYAEYQAASGSQAAVYALYDKQNNEYILNTESSFIQLYQIEGVGTIPVSVGLTDEGWVPLAGVQAGDTKETVWMTPVTNTDGVYETLNYNAQASTPWSMTGEYYRQDENKNWVAVEEPQEAEAASGGSVYVPTVTEESVFDCNQYALKGAASRIEDIDTKDVEKDPGAQESVLSEAAVGKETLVSGVKEEKQESIDYKGLTLEMAGKMESLLDQIAQVSGFNGAHPSNALDFTVQQTLMTPCQPMHEGWTVNLHNWDGSTYAMTLGSAESFNVMQSVLNNGNVRAYECEYTNPLMSEVGPATVIDALGHMDAMVFFAQSLSGSGLAQQAAFSANSVITGMQNIIDSGERLLSGGGLSAEQEAVVGSLIGTAQSIQADARVMLGDAEVEGADIKTGSLEGVTTQMGHTIDGGVDGFGGDFRSMDRFCGRTLAQAEAALANSKAVQEAVYFERVAVGYPLFEGFDSLGG